jgi:hypothetical protein
VIITFSEGFLIVTFSSNTILILPFDTWVAFNPGELPTIFGGSRSTGPPDGEAMLAQATIVNMIIPETNDKAIYFFMNCIIFDLI